MSLMRQNFGHKKREFGGKSKNHGDRRKFRRSGRTPPRAGTHRGEKIGKIEIEGIIKLAGRKGGFIDYKNDEVNILPDYLGTALHNDTVLVIVHSDGRTGEVVKVITRFRDRFVGTIVNSKFIPDDRRFYLDTAVTWVSDTQVEGQKVLVRITDWHTMPIKGEVIEVLGKQGEHETEIKSILAVSGIVYDFPAEVETEAREVATRLHQDSGEARRDMRKTLTLTIDPADAKDFDDAISLEDLGDGKYELGVHIADVSYFVRPGTRLDSEASRRANSVYMVDRTVPMLPEVLSADICSLVPNQDRFTYSAIFVMNREGKVESEWFGRTIIHSKKRFTYEEAAQILETGVGTFAGELKILNEIAKKLYAERLKRGSIIFDKDEVKIELDKDKKPVRVVVKERLPTHKLIEEFMLLANKHVAHYLFRGVGKLGGGAVYRIHDVPDKDRIALVKQFLKSLGYKIEGEWKTFGHKQINDLFAQVKGADIEALVQTAVLRSMAKAIYSTRNIGHFGLGFEFYTHFTSPIRRYPDIMVHRLLTKYLSGNAISKQEVLEFERVLQYSSQKEREAESAERESIKYKQAEYMLVQLKTNPLQQYHGTITGVTEWGIFIEEELTKSEGMLRLSSLGDDYYEFDEKKFALVGKKTKKSYRLGNKLKVKLSEVDIPRHQITWELAVQV